MARYNDILTRRHNYIGIFAWGVIAIVLMVLLLPFGLAYLTVTKIKKLFAVSDNRQPVAKAQSLPAQ